MAIWPPPWPARQPLPVGLRHQCPVVLEQVKIELPETFDDVLMGIAVELGQRRIVPERRRDQRGQPGVLEMRGEMNASVLPGHGGLDHRFESVVREPGRLLVEPNDIVERVELVTGALQPSREGEETTTGQGVSLWVPVGNHLEMCEHGVESAGERLHGGTTVLGVILQRRPVERAVENLVNGSVELAGCLVGMQLVQPGDGVYEQLPLGGVAVDHSVRQQA